MSRLDRKTFDQLVRDHHPAVYRSALRVLRRQSDAEDVAQDVFVRALLGKVPLAAGGERAALCWLSTRLALNALRGVRRRTAKEQGAAMPNPDPIPVQLAADQELQHCVRRSIDELPADLRLPLQLRFEDQLTYAAVGSALAMSESTAHERVQSALQRLRQRLHDNGFAVAAASLPGLLAATPGPVPPGLEGRLLAIGNAPLATSAFGKVAALLMLLGVSVVSAVALSRGSEPEPPSVTASAAARPALPPDASPLRRTLVADAATATPAGAPGQQPETATKITWSGTVRDAQAWPVAGARVVAVAAGNLKPFECAATTTDAQGTFRLELPPDGGPLRPSLIRIRVLEQSQLLLQTDEMPLAARPEALQLILPPGAGVETSRFVLAVTVRDGDGKPLAGVPVGLCEPDGSARSLGLLPPEVQAITDAVGVARLSGRSPGDKLVFADGRKLGLQALTQTVKVQQPGELDASVELPPALLLQGSLCSADGTPLPWANVWLRDETNGLYHQPDATVRDTFCFHGLGPGPYTLHADAPEFSPADLHAVRPDGGPLEVLLKRSDDLRDIGVHLAEIHGRLLDADGAPLDFGDHEVEVRPALDGESSLVMDCIAPPRPVQIMLSDARHQAFHLVGLAAGRWGVVVRRDGYAPAAAIVELRERELRTDLELRLERPATLRGTVRDAAGKPIAGAFVTVLGLGDRADRNLAELDQRQQGDDPRRSAGGSSCCGARTGDDGSFALAAVPPGVRLRVVAVARGSAPAQGAAMTLVAGQTRSDCELRLARR